MTITTRDQLIDALAAIFDDRATQRGDEVDRGGSVCVLDHACELRSPVARDIEHEKAWCAFGDAVLDLVIYAGLNRRECDE